MGILKKTALAAILFAVYLLAGCLGPSMGPSGIRSAAQVSKFDNFHKAGMVVTDGYGNLLATHPFLSDPETAPVLSYQLTPNNGPEPHIAVTDKGTVLVSTMNRVVASWDHGATWSVVWNYASPRAPNMQNRYGSWDPMLWMDPSTDRVFIAHLGPLEPYVTGGGLGLPPMPWCVYLLYSDDEGKTWSDGNDPVFGKVPTGSGTGGVQSCLFPFIDHQKIAAGKPGPKTSDHFRSLREGTPNKWENVLYLCYNKYDVSQGVLNTYAWKNDVTGTWCEVSFDSGQNFVYSKQVVNQRGDGVAAGCFGINGHPTVHTDGTVFLPLGGFPETRCGNLPPTVAVSEDSGQTWTIRPMDDATVGQMEIDPDITVTPDGTAYMLFRNKNQHAMLARSHDKFQTWEGPWRVSPPDHTLNVFTGISSGDDGRIAMTYLGTVTPQTKLATPSNATGGTLWDAYVTYSVDADSASPTFFTQQVNPTEDPVQVGCVWLRGGPSACRNLLDFIDAVTDAEGRMFSVVTDGCNPRNGCTADTDSANYQSRDAQATVIVQDGGLSLFAEKGNLGRFWLQNPQPLPR
ncbi:MAG: exo-alpha-sialidase [Euryarchaeota archaeon]|nr:exo-alpha-sialidase [Euryarchaeota archaeon]